MMLSADERRALVIELRMDAEDIAESGNRDAAERIDLAADALEKTLPEEREGQCWCGRCKHEAGVWVEIVCPDECCGAGVWRYDGSYCPRCGAELGAGGVARRNADAARVERVREALSGIQCHVDIGCDCDPAYIDGCEQTVTDICAALDGPGGADDAND